MAVSNNYNLLRDELQSTKEDLALSRQRIDDLEQELLISKEKYDALQASVRDSIGKAGKLIQAIKRHKVLYGLANSGVRTIKKLKRSTPQSYISTRSDVSYTISPSSAIQVIHLSTPVKRLNLVFESFSRNSFTDYSKAALLLAIQFSHQYHYVLRIITRCNMADARIFQQFLRENNFSQSIKPSFYTDARDRVAQSQHRLELTSDDIFFATSTQTVKAILHTNKLIQRVFCIELPPKDQVKNQLIKYLPAKPKPSAATIKQMENWINGK